MGRQEELTALNSTDYIKQFTFTLNDGTGDYILEYAPDGWEDDEFVMTRNMQNFGVFRKFTVSELKFVKDGRDYLSAAYEAGGVNASVSFTVTELTPSGITRNRFSGFIDFSTYKITDISVDVQIIDGSFTDLVLSRSKNEINLLGTKSIDGASIGSASLDYLTIPEINIIQVGNWEGADTSMPFDQTPTINHNLQLKELTGEFTEAKNSDYYVSGTFFDLAIDDYPSSSLSLKLSALAVGSASTASFSWKFILEKINSGTTTELWSEIKICYGLSTQIDIDIVDTFDLVVGDLLILRAEITNTAGTGNIHYDFITVKLSSQIESIQSKTIQSILYHEAFDRVVTILTGTSGRFKSDFFGRTDIGYAVDGVIGALVTGRFIRDVYDVNNTFTVSLESMFNSFKSIYCLGMAVELIDGVEMLVVEPISYFFKDSILLDISNRIDPETITKEYYPELAYNRISVGYNSFEYLQIGGIYEFNTTSRYTTIIKPVDKELNLISPFRSDMSGIIQLLKETVQNKDVTGEGDIYVIDTIRDGSSLVARTSEDFDQSDDLGNRDVLLNLDITPARNIRRWGAYLRGFLDKYLTSELIWQTSDKNTKLVSTETGQSTITENSDILVSDLDTPLWHPEIVQFEVPALENDIDIIKLNPYGLIKYTATDYGWILNYKAKNENEKSEYLLLRCNTTYVTPIGIPPIYPATLNINLEILGRSNDNQEFTLVLLKDGLPFLTQTISQDNQFLLNNAPYGVYTISINPLDDYTNVSIVDSEVTISTTNLHETVLITNAYNFGSITVSKVITDAPADMTYFMVTLTGQSAEPTIVTGYINQSEPVVFNDLPYDTYVLTEETVEGYVSGTVDPIELTLLDGNKSMEVVNEVAQGLELTFNDIVNVPVADASSVSNWNTFFGFDSDPTLYVTIFSSVEVIGNMIRLKGGTGITCKLDLFWGNTNLVSVIDYSSINILSTSIFYGCSRLVSCILLKATASTSYLFGNCINIETIYMPEMGISWWSAYINCNAIKTLYLPKCSIFGDTVLDNGLFTGTIGNIITLTVPSTPMTCNGGEPDGDIQYLIDNNTVTIITT
jgi:hypothetical protein